MARIFEGFTRQAADGIRRFFMQAPEQQSQELKQGAIPPMDKAGLPYSLTSQFSNDTMGEHLRIDTDLQARYTDYEEASLYPEMSCALDIYADDSTTPTMETGQSIWVESPERDVAIDLNNMLHKRVNVEDDIWGHSRELGLYGNEYGELLVNETGIIGVNYLSPPTVRRIEDPRGTLLGFLQDIRGEFNVSLEDFYTLAASRNRENTRGRAPGEQTVFEDWEIVHWRLRTQHLRSIYGHSLLEAARYPWKRLSLLEDALLIYKLERAPSRYAFYVDVGELDAERGLAYVNRVKNQFTRKSFVNPTTGKLDFRYNPLSHDEDFWIPVRGGKRTTEVDIVQGPDYSETDTVEYHRDKLVSALKIPKSYMGYGGEATRGALSTEDIRFARTIMRVQRAERMGWNKVCRVHIVARGGDPNAFEYDTKMNIPSVILDLARVEVLSAKSNVALQMGEQISTKWILTNIYRFSEDEAVKVMEEKRQELLGRGKIDAAVQKMLEGNVLPKGHPLTDGQEIDRRLKQLEANTKRYDWRKGFDNGTRNDEKRWGNKLEKLMRENRMLSSRVHGLSGLMADIRQSFRSVPPEA